MAYRLGQANGGQNYGYGGAGYKGMAQPGKGSLPNTSSTQGQFSYDAILQATDGFSSARKIGDGGFGPVFKGTLLHTPVAVKVLKAGSGQGVDHFDQEVRLLSALRHPNLVTLLGFSVGPKGERCLVYELLSGGSVDDYLASAWAKDGKRPVLSWSERLKISAGAARGLLFLHSGTPPVVHLDFKGANVLLDDLKNAKVGDFGLARQMTPSQPAANNAAYGRSPFNGANINAYGANNAYGAKTHVSTNHLVGTLGFICPEYAASGHFDARCDVFSFGVFLLQMLSGRPALSPQENGPTLVETFKRAAEVSPDALYELRDARANWPPALFHGLWAVARECVRSRRSKRPDMATVLDQLAALDRTAGADASSGAGVAAAHQTGAAGGAAAIINEAPPPAPGQFGNQPLPPRTEARVNEEQYKRPQGGCPGGVGAAAPASPPKHQGQGLYNAGSAPAPVGAAPPRGAPMAGRQLVGMAAMAAAPYATSSAGRVQESETMRQQAIAEKLAELRKGGLGAAGAAPRAGAYGSPIRNDKEAPAGVRGQRAGAAVGEVVPPFATNYGPSSGADNWGGEDAEEAGRQPGDLVPGPDRIQELQQEQRAAAEMAARMNKTSAGWWPSDGGTTLSRADAPQRPGSAVDASRQRAAGVGT
eukprot:jgi/Mesvir1/8238/Mv12519-RA.1